MTIPSEAAEEASSAIVPMYRAPWSVRFAGYALPIILLLFVAFFSLAAPTMFPLGERSKRCLEPSQSRQFWRLL